MNSARTTFALAAVALAAATAAPSAFSAAGVPPKAVLTVSPNPAQAGQIVSFSAGSSAGDGQGGNIRSYEWDLDGNGTFEVNTGTTGSTARLYGDPGTYTTTLRVTDTEGDVAQAAVPLRINAPPKARFIHQPESPKQGQRIVLASTSSDPDGTIPASGYAWDLNDDGVYDDATGETVSTSFRKPGKHQVRLQVTDADGAANKFARKIEVVPKTGDLKLMKPFPTVRLRGAITSGGDTEIDLLAISGPKGAKAAVRCRGGSCPFKSRKRRLRDRHLEFPEMRGRFGAGVVIDVRVTEPKRIGKYTRFKLRDGKVPRREDRCLQPGKHRPIDCPR
jgi:hypothetical protein